MRGSQPVRIANCSGFYGDRAAALAELAASGTVDVITGDYLAEVTMLVLAKSRLKDPTAGYARSFLAHLEPALSNIVKYGIKVVVNAGGLNPSGLADATRALLERHGVGLMVATVEGDDLLDRLPTLPIRHLVTGQPLADWQHKPMTANAYLGGFGITRALAAGADIVITGRVADASLVSGAAAWWWDWHTTDLNPLAGAVAAGHVIECGTQATGGNYSGFQLINGLERPGFPIAEVDRDGTAVITKVRGTGGAVTPDTVTAQLLYEIGDPAYLNPDVVAHLNTVAVTDLGQDRVRMSGTLGTLPPPTTKVAVTAIAGWRNSATFLLTGLDVDAKAELLERTIRARLAAAPPLELSFSRLGIVQDNPQTQGEATCLLVISALGTEASVGRAFSSALVELTLATYPGCYRTAPPSPGGSYGAYWPGLVDQASVRHQVRYAGGDVEQIAPPRSGALPKARSDVITPAAPPDLGRTIEIPLGRIAHARSGDKGGDANVGVWVTDDAAYEWLRHMLTTDALRLLIPEANGLDIARFELPNLRALNFVITGLLGDGATSATRFDKQAKALAEWLRARIVPVPERLLPSR